MSPYTTNKNRRISGSKSIGLAKMSIEKFELESYTAEGIHHMLKLFERALEDDFVVVAYEA